MVDDVGRNREPVAHVQTGLIHQKNSVDAEHQGLKHPDQRQVPCCDVVER